MGAHVDPAYLEFPHRWYRDSSVPCICNLHIKPYYTHCLLQLLFVYPWTCRHIQTHDASNKFYSVTCIHDTCTASSCMYGSPPSPNCLPLYMHKLAMSQQQLLLIYLLVMDELQNKPWRVLVQGSSSYMHTLVR